MTGYIIFAHGSSIENANESVRKVTAEFARAGGHELVEPAFLEGGEPLLPAAVERIIERGVRHFVFDVPEVEQLPYLPGQFFSFSHQIGEKKVARAYSTASPPSGN